LITEVPYAEIPAAFPSTIVDTKVDELKGLGSTKILLSIDLDVDGVCFDLESESTVVDKD
jgi:hypothetical protein